VDIEEKFLITLDKFKEVGDLCAFIMLDKKLKPKDKNMLIKFFMKSGVNFAVKGNVIMINLQSLFYPKYTNNKKEIKYWVQALIRLRMRLTEYEIVRVQKSSHENNLLFTIFKEYIDYKRNSLPLLSYNTDSIEKYGAKIIRSSLFDCGDNNYVKNPLHIKFTRLAMDKSLYFIITKEHQFYVESKSGLFKVFGNTGEQLFNYIITELHNYANNELIDNVINNEYTLLLIGKLDDTIELKNSLCDLSLLNKIKYSLMRVKWDNSQINIHKLFCDNVTISTPFYEFRICNNILKISYGLCEDGSLHLLIKARVIWMRWLYPQDKYYILLPIPKKRIGFKIVLSYYKDLDNIIEYNKLPPIVQKLGFKNKEGKYYVSFIYE